MEQLFLRAVSLSLSAGWLVLAVVLLRQVLRRSPRRIVCLLWALVALRLLCPAQITWRASLVPARQTVAQTAQTTLPQPAEPAQAASADPGAETPRPALTQTLSRVWAAGVLAMLLWAAVSDVRLRARLRTACRREEQIWVCDGIDSPFVFGVVRPRIYLPPGLDEEQTAYVLAHERAHIARGDHVWKPLGWLLLSVYWFHPLLWLAYALLCRDLELACDERVARGLDRAGIAAYAETLLLCGCRRFTAPASPVAFGELGVKARVKAILRYRKPVFVRVAIALAVVAVTGALFLTERPAAVLELTAPAAEEAAELRVSEPGDLLPPEAEEDPASAQSLQDPDLSVPELPASAQPAGVYGSEELQAERDAYLRQLNEQIAQEHREAAEANERAAAANASQPQQTVGWQSAIDVQPHQPAIPTMPDPNPTNSLGVVQNGDYYVIRVFP